MAARFLGRAPGTNAQSGDGWRAVMLGSEVQSLYRLNASLRRRALDADSRVGFELSTMALRSGEGAWAECAAVADRVADEWGDLGPRFAEVVASPALHRRFCRAAVVAYSRVDRQADAREVCHAVALTDSVQGQEWEAELLAESDAQRALQLLTSVDRLAGKPSDRREVLRAFVESDHSDSARRPGDRYFQTMLAAVGPALRGHRWNEARAAINGFFSAYGLEAPLELNDIPPSFTELGAATGVSPHPDLVTIVMTTYNSEGTVAHALGSLLAQSHRNIEVIVVDDASTDATVSVVTHIAANDRRVRLVPLEHNGGTYAAKNLGITMGAGAFFTCHDSDDWAHPRRIERHLDMMAAHPRALASRSAWFRATENLEVALNTWAWQVLEPNASSAFYARAVIEGAGLFDEVRFGADSEYWARVRARCGTDATHQEMLPLAVGLRRADSLTTAGVGAYGASAHNPLRAAYTMSWKHWHAATAAPQLPSRADERPYWAPPAMVASITAAACSLASPGRSYRGLGEPRVLVVTWAAGGADRCFTADPHRLETTLAGPAGSWIHLDTSDSPVADPLALDPRIFAVEVDTREQNFAALALAARVGGAAWLLVGREGLALDSAAVEAAVRDVHLEPAVTTIRDAAGHAVAVLVPAAVSTDGSVAASLETAVTEVLDLLA
jgi:hypothetical protein